MTMDLKLLIFFIYYVIYNFSCSIIFIVAEYQFLRIKIKTLKPENLLFKMFNQILSNLSFNLF